MTRNMGRTFAKGGEDWEVSIWNPYPQVVASEGSAYSRGQCAFDTSGAVLASGDLLEQIRLAVRYGLRSFSELDMGADQLSRAVIYYDAKLGFSEAKIEEFFNEQLPPGAQRLSVMLVPLHGFPEIGMVQEIDFYGSTDRVQRQSGGGTNAVQAGDTIYISGISAPSGSARGAGGLAASLRSIREQLAKALEPFGAELDDIAKLKTYVASDLLQTQAHWQALVENRAAWFKSRFPVITDVPLADFPVGVDLRVDAIAIAKSAENQAYEPIEADGTGRLPFASPHPAALRTGSHFYVGGRLGLTPSGEVIEAGVPEYQTRCIMQDLGRLLQAAGLDYRNVIKKTTYFIGERGNRKDIQRNFSIRASHYKQPGPASTGINIQTLPIEGAMLVVEATAVRD